MEFCVENNVEYYPSEHRFHQNVSITLVLAALCSINMTVNMNVCTQQR